MCCMASRCCCYFSLEVGTQLISIFSNVIAAILVVVYGYAATVVRLRGHGGVNLIYGGAALASAVQLGLGCLLVYGIFKRRPRLLLPWVLFVGLESLALIVFSVVGVAALSYSESSSPDASLMITVYFVYSVFLAYCVHIVNSRRYELLHDLHDKRLMRPTGRAWQYA